ncbi:hypothetical protein O6H91_Y579000 [Diphasiastrum complanatum]|nr:hypothetical protein O6H91_Y579000 [Diphasiastrum complanatum]
MYRKQCTSGLIKQVMDRSSEERYLQIWDLGETKRLHRRVTSVSRQANCGRGSASWEIDPSRSGWVTTYVWRRCWYMYLQITYKYISKRTLFIAISYVYSLPSCYNFFIFNQDICC